MTIQKDKFGVPRNQFGVPVHPDGSVMQTSTNQIEENPMNEGQVTGATGGEGGIQGFKNAERDTSKYIPAVVGGLATSTLGPEVGWPVYAVLGGLSQGATRAGLNALEGKDILNKETATDTALGAVGGPLVKYAGILGKTLGEKAAMAGLGEEFSPAVKELAKDVVEGGRGKVIGPETKVSLEDLLKKAATPEESTEITNLLNKTPTSVFRVNPINEEMSSLQQQVADLLRNVKPAGNMGKLGLGTGSNVSSQALVRNTSDIANSLKNELINSLKPNQ